VERGELRVDKKNERHVVGSWWFQYQPLFGLRGVVECVVLGLA
jgi:hypothetical protein